MRLRFGLVALMLLVGGCSAYKELSPDPKLISIEQGFVELRNDDELFELEQGKKYYIKFPAPFRDSFDLVLSVQGKNQIISYLTPSFENGNDASQRIPDQTPENDSLIVYAVSTSRPVYFWVIESVRRDMNLVMHYRYVPHWRFTFENNYRNLRNATDDNSVSRATFNSITLDFDFDNFDFSKPLDELAAKTPRIQNVQDKLRELGALFPDDVKAARDTAYLQYQDLSQTVDKELEFQKMYKTVLEVFRQEKGTRGNVQRFVEAIPEFAQFFSQQDKYPARIMDKARQVFVKRLAEATAYYDGRLRAKSDLSSVSSLDQILILYRACNVPVPGDVEHMSRFVDRYNIEVAALAKYNARVKEIDARFTKVQGGYTDTLFMDLQARVNELKTLIPESQAVNTPQYGLYPCAILLDNSIRDARRQANFLQGLYQSGQRLVDAINRGAWPFAEGELKSLSNWRDETAGSVFLTHKARLLRVGEDEIFRRVKEASKERVDRFVALHLTTIDNVAALYNDSVFTPVYQIAFSPQGEQRVIEKRREIDTYLDQKKNVEFPESAIKAIYQDFSRDLNDRGVEKARAIVEHGKHYKGNDRQVKGLIDECDPQVPKWIVKARDYRRLYAFPVTTNIGGTNQYVFRIRLQIPSDAQFPVFDVNIKLPQQIASNAGTRQWYDEITINQKPIKNEGRFRITAPSSDNNYESQVSPVQMDKDGKNILEVKFSYPGFRVFEISAMAQVPIIRKN